MEYFDFHHHSPEKWGIYNLNITEAPVTQSFSAGILPQHFLGRNGDDLFQKLVQSAQEKNCVVIGECGLDSRVLMDNRLQVEIFKKHIELAEDLGKPLIVHCVRKFPELVEIKKKNFVKMALHGFNKKKETADALLQHGFYLSFGAALFQSVSLQIIFAEAPADRVFIETDAEENTEIGEIYKLAADLKAISTENLQEIILENFENFKK